MKRLFPLFMIASLAAQGFGDELPRSPRPDRYKDLYLNSAFVDPPDPPDPVDENPDLPDWVLVGLSEYASGTKVRLMNKKDRSRVTIPSPEATEMGFAIKSIEHDRNFIDGAVVTLKKGTQEGEVRFDPKFLVLKKIAGAPTVASKGKSSSNSKGSSGKPSSNRPPIPGRSTSSSSSSERSLPRPGSTSSNVPRPSSSSSSTRSSSGGWSSKGRPRIVPRTR